MRNRQAKVTDDGFNQIPVLACKNQLAICPFTLLDGMHHRGQLDGLRACTDDDDEFSFQLGHAGTFSELVGQAFGPVDMRLPGPPFFFKE